MAKNEFDELMSVGVDIGKDVFHLVGFDHDGQRVVRKNIALPRTRARESLSVAFTFSSSATYQWMLSSN